jgi:hypothetical protein
MAEQIFVGESQVADDAEGEEIFAGTALFSEEAAAAATVEYSPNIIHNQSVTRASSY